MAFRSVLSSTRIYSRLATPHVRTFYKISSSSRSKINPFLVGTLFVTTGVVVANGPYYLHPAKTDYEAVRKDIAELIEKVSNEREDGSGIGPTFVRLAWHASGTYSKEDGTGGSNGATMRFSPEKDWGANAGLQIARDLLETIKQKYPGISYADLWTLAGVVAIEEMGGPKITWRPGRVDDVDGKRIVPDGRLPSADAGSPEKTAQHVRDIFYRMGFNDREIVALIGAHCLGRCRVENSGYFGPWTRGETTFSNEFFRLLKEGKWKTKTTHKGGRWTGPFQYESPEGDIMMLPADMVLIQDPKFKEVVDLYASNEELFFQDFSSAFSKLLELGVDFKSKGCKKSFWSKFSSFLGLK